MTHNPRFYVLGTDTDAGKTFALERLILKLRNEGHSVLPFKPAQSGNESYLESDIGRLATAARLSESLGQKLTAHRYDVPKAPGCVHDASLFIAPQKDPDDEPLRIALRALEDLEAELSPAVTFCEGAGGIHVPMPGGSWQLDWVQTLAPRVILVARSSLGTINHTLLSVHALRHAGLEIEALIFTDSRNSDPALVRENIHILLAQTDIPCLAKPDLSGGLTFDESVLRALMTPNA